MYDTHQKKNDLIVTGTVPDVRKHSAPSQQVFAHKNTKRNKTRSQRNEKALREFKDVS